jgi:iron complex outermembrane receptor protein
LLKKLMMGAALAALATAPTASAWAQTGDTAKTSGGLETVVVTAERKEENLQSVPASVTAITADDLDTRKLNDLTQITLATPSFELTTDNAFTLRGIGSTIFLSTVDSSVGVMVDDVSLGSPIFQSNGIFNDLARIEVLEGPQGLLFGRNASAGLLQIVTNKPVLGETSGMANVEYDGRDSAPGGQLGAVFRGTLNLPVTDDSALRINVLGSFQNPIAKANLNLSPNAQLNQTRLAAKAKYLWEPDDDTSVYFIGDYSTERGVGGIWDRTFRDAGTGIYIAANAAAGAIPGPKNLRFGIDASADFRSVDTYGAQVTITHKLAPGLTISDIAAWRQYYLSLALDTDYSALDLVNDNTHTETYTQYSNELRLAFEGDRIDGQAGIYNFWLNDSGQTVLLASLGSGIANFAGGDFVGTNTARSIAGYGQVNFHATDALTLIAGARVTNDRVSILTTEDTGTYVLNLLLFGPTGTFHYARSNTNFSYKLGAQYSIDDDTMLYATYSTGYKAPAYPTNLASNVVPIDPYIGPETVGDFEAGIKSTMFDNRLRLNVSGFLEKFHDFQTQTYDAAAGQIVYANAGGVRSNGIEISGSAKPTDQLTINFGATILSSKFTDFITSCFPGQTVAQGCVGGLFQAAGLAPPTAAKFTSTLEGVYEIPFDDEDLTLEANWYHRTRLNFSPNGDPGTALGGVDVLGANISYHFANGSELNVFCKNCADERVPTYLSHVFGDATAIIQSWDYNSVRTIGASYTINF